MGACTFIERSKGKTATEAFLKARQSAQWDHGHAGYTGTIAEKDDFIVIEPPADADPQTYARLLIEQSDERIDDKWGPAGAIRLSKDEWLFFGWASS